MAIVTPTEVSTVTEKSSAKEKLGNLCEPLKQIEQSIITFFPPNVQDLAKEALLIPKGYIGQEYDVPGPQSLPYILKILQNSVNCTDTELFTRRLFVHKADVNNIRLTNNAIDENAGNVAISLNIATRISLPTTPQDQPCSIALAYQGDEILLITYIPTDDLDEGKKAAELLQQQLDLQNQQAVATFEEYHKKTLGCTLKRSQPSSITQIDIEPPHDRRIESTGLRTLDIATALYNAPLLSDSKHNQGISVDILKSATDHAEMPSFREDPLEKEEENALPSYIQNILKEAGNTPISRELARKATFNEMYPRKKNEFVYNPRPFYELVCEKLLHRGDKVYKMIMVGPPEIKPLNEKFGHDAGDDVLKSSNRLIHAKFGDHALVLQSRGSLFAFVEADEKFDENIRSFMDTIEPDKIVHPESHLQDPAIVVSVVNQERWEIFQSQLDNKLLQQSPDARNALFWSFIIDDHRQLHYSEELLQSLEKLPSELVWKVVQERFITRMKDLRSLLTEKLFREGVGKLFAVDIDLLQQMPQRNDSLTDLIDYMIRIQNLLRRLNHTEQGWSLSAPHPSHLL